MTLGADIAAVLPELRVQAESLHQDTFTVYRKTGATVTDPDTLVESAQYATVLASVKGKLQSGSAQANDAEIPGQKVIETALFWHTSVKTLGVLPDDEVLCIAAGPLSDPEIVGSRVRITGPFLKSLATARRFPVEEQS